MRRRRCKDGGSERGQLAATRDEIGMKVRLHRKRNPQVEAFRELHVECRIPTRVNDQSPAAADFHQKILKAYGDDPFPIAPAQAYDATRMMLMALSKSGPDSAKLRDAIENLDGFTGVTAAPSRPFSPDRHHSLEGKDMFAAVWKNGELVKAQ